MSMMPVGAEKKRGAITTRGAITARGAALAALSLYRRNGILPDNALNTVLCENPGLSERDTALALRIMRGVLQNLMLLDFYIGSYSAISLKKIHPQALDILRVTIYQILFLTKIPHSAAVNEGVKEARKRLQKNPRAAGFVNALLRRISADAVSGSLPEITGKTECARLSVLYSHPLWLTGRFYAMFGSETELLLKANNDSETPVTVQVNTLKTDSMTVSGKLQAGERNYKEHPFLPDCFLLSGAGALERLDVFAKGFVYVQDAAARMAVLAAGIKPGDFVIDGCAAPGGKSFASAILMGNSGKVLACDINGGKLRLIKEGAGRLGISIIETRAMDASVFSEDLHKTADVVIADVLCSGFGVISKKPEIRYKEESEVAVLPELQLKILRNLSAYVKPGGVLIYSTCTILPEENEEVIAKFMKETNVFKPEGFSVCGTVAPEGMLTLLPHINGTDGFFICKLRRSVAL